MKKDVRFGEGKTSIFLDPTAETFYDMASESDRASMEKFGLKMYWVSRTGLSGGGKLDIDNTPLMEVGYYRLRGEASGYRPYGRRHNESGKPVGIGNNQEVYLLVPWVKDSSDDCPQGILRKFPVVLTDRLSAVVFFDSRYIAPTSMLKRTQDSTWRPAIESGSPFDEAWQKKVAEFYTSPSGDAEGFTWYLHNTDHFKGPNALDFLQVGRMRSLLDPELAEEFQPFWPSSQQFREAQKFCPRRYDDDPICFLEQIGFRRGQYKPEEKPFFWYQDSSGRCFRHFGHEDPRFIEGHIVGRWYGDGHGMLYRRNGNRIYAFVVSDEGYEYEVSKWAWDFWENPERVRRQCMDAIHQKMDVDASHREKKEVKRRLEKEDRDELLGRMKTAPNIPISLEDSRAVGNCDYGTEQFLERYNLPTSGTLGFLVQHDEIESMLCRADFRRAVLHVLKNNNPT